MCVLAHVLGTVLYTHGLACMCDCVETRNLYQVPSTFFFNRLSVNKPGMTCLSLPPQQCVCTEPSFYVGAWAPNSGTHAVLLHLPCPPSLLKVWLLTSARHHISVLFLTGWLLPPKLFAGSFIRPMLHMRAHHYDQNGPQPSFSICSLQLTSSRFHTLTLQFISSTQISLLMSDN